MQHNNTYKNNHVNKILKKILTALETEDPVYIGNNLNDFLDSDLIDREFESVEQNQTSRQKRAILDVKRGRLFEDILQLLLKQTFKNNKSYKHIKVSRLNEIDNFKVKEKISQVQLKRINTRSHKKPDIDLVIYSEIDKYKNKFIFLSVKGTARERIGQFLSNLFIFDPIVIKSKYIGKSYFFEFEKNELELIEYKMAFVCFDIAKHKDFSFEDKNRIINKQKSQKQMEVYLVDDDPNIGLGVFVLNNLPKLHKVGTFSELVGKIKAFFK